jgi:hypothetical protein
MGISIAGCAGAYEYAFVGARASGMAGANAASTRDSTAIWQNPAAFGFMGQAQWATNAADNGHLSEKKFSWEVVGVGAGAALTEDMGRYLGILADIDFDKFDSGRLSGNGENVRSLLRVAGIVGSLNSGDAMYADASVGTSFQIGRMGFGLRVFGEGAAYALPDRDNLSLLSYPNTAAFVAELDAAAANEGFSGTGYTFGVLSPQQQTDLGATLGVASTSDTVKYLDSKFTALAGAGDLTGEEISAALDTIAGFIPGSGGSIDSNQTAVVGRGVLVAEVPVSFGWAMNENLSFGATAKLMHGTVTGAKVWIFNENNDAIFDDMSDNVESTLTVGLDLAALYRMNNFQFALVGHNLNRPKFKGFTDTVTFTGKNNVTFTDILEIPDVALDPQITFGAAYMPSRRFTLETSLELLETGTLLDDYDIQRLAIGTEIDIWAIMLRLGAYNNLAVSWQDWVGTAGIGANIFGVRADIGGALSLTESTEYEGTKVPNEMRLYASIGLDF